MKFILALASLALFFSTAQANTKYDDVRAYLEDIVAHHSDVAQIVTVGKSDTGDDIVAIKIGDGEVHNLVVATHHGNEYGSTEVAKAFAAAVASRPLEGQTIYVVPVLNIYGYNRGQREERAGGRSYDPNRDYPAPCNTETPFNLKSTKALDEFLEKEKIVSTATLHTHYPAVTWPWGMSTHDREPPNKDIFKKLARFATRESKYEVGNSADVVYPADGTYEDYVYAQYGIFSLLFEIGRSHSPSPSDVEELIRVNVPGLRLMFENSPEARAEDHEFKGACDHGLRSLDLHDE